MCLGGSTNQQHGADPGWISASCADHAPKSYSDRDQIAEGDAKLPRGHSHPIHRSADALIADRDHHDHPADYDRFENVLHRVR